MFPENPNGLSHMGDNHEQPISHGYVEPHFNDMTQGGQMQPHGMNSIL